MAKKKSAAKNGNGDLGDTFTNDLHKDLRADFIITNPPFNVKEWGGERLREDKRWKFGSPSLESMRPFWRKV